MRPDFLTKPGCWVRTPRSASSPVDAAPIVGYLSNGVCARIGRLLDKIWRLK